jgi:hypothetical protein
MTTAHAEDFSELHERVLRFMGAFSSTQFAIDNVIGLYLRRRLPDLGSALQKQFLGKIRDDQRLPLFQAFADEARYEGDLTHFEPIYLRAKQVRDMIGHSLHVTGPVYSPNRPPFVGVTRVSNTKIERAPSPLFPSTFVRLTADCEWITEHVWRAGYMAEPDMFVRVDGKPTEPPVPAASPEGGEPLG